MYTYTTRSRRLLELLGTIGRRLGLLFLEPELLAMILLFEPLRARLLSEGLRVKLLELLRGKELLGPLFTIAAGEFRFARRRAEPGGVV
jgi:hypothetical protein